MGNKREAFEKLYKIVWECSEDDLILHDDEGLEWINDSTDGDHIGIAVITSDFVIDDFGDEKFEAVRCDRYYDPVDFCNFICSRIRDIAKYGSTRLIDVEDLDMNIRRSLVRGGLIYVKDLDYYPVKRLKEFRGIGKKRLADLTQWCDAHDIFLTF